MIFFVKNRWFLLALAFLGLNGFAVFRGGHSDKEIGVALVSGTTVETGSHDPLRWRFSSAQEPLAEPVTFAPAVEGEFEWESPRELVFRPREGWQGCERFTATLAGDSSVFTFESTPLLLLNVLQSSYSSRATQLTLSFNAAVSPKQLPAHLRLETVDGKPISYSIYGTSRIRDSVTISFQTPSTNQVVANISAGLLPASGMLGMQCDEVRTAELSRELKITRVLPKTKPFTQSYIDVRFNLPIDPALANELITVSPVVEVNVAAYYRNQYRIWGDFVPGQNYTLTFGEGLKSTMDARLEQDVVRAVRFPGARPSLEFAARGTYMSSKGGMKISLRLINVAKGSATVERIYPNNLVQLAARREGRLRDYYGSARQGLAHELGKIEFSVDAPRNEIVEHALDLRPLLDGATGVFHVEVNGEYSDSHGHYVVVSDIGISARRSAKDCLVWANSLRTLAPIVEADVTIYSDKNQVLVRGKTDAAGIARLDLEFVEGEPFLVSIEKGDDLTFMPLDDSAVAQRGAIGSRPYLDEGYEAFLYTDRGVYRPGETARLKIIVRDENACAPEPFPIQIELFRPDGKVDREASAMLNACGTTGYSVPWPSYAATGKYTFKASVPGGESIGQLSVSVEEFVPPQIRVNLNTPGGRIAAGSPFKIEVEAEHFFGRPAEGAPVASRIEFTPVAFKPEGWENFIFGDPRRKFQPIRASLGRGKLDADGAATFSATASDRWQPPAAIKALVSGTVNEVSGRGVTAYAGQTIDVYPFYLGLCRATNTLEVVAVRPDAMLAASVENVTVSLERIMWNSVLKKIDGHYVYHSEMQTTPVAEYDLTLSDGRGQTGIMPKGSGDYRLSVFDPISGVASSMEFYVSADSQHWAERSMEAPDMVELELDQNSYVAGETATLTLKAPFVGQALCSVESDHVLSHRVLTLTNNTAEISFPVEDSFGPNVYCAVSVLRAALPEETWGRHRASGRIALRVDNPERELTVDLEMPSEIRPCSTLTIPVRVSDSNGDGLVAELTLAAVDEGICMLSDFKTPNPHAFFFAPRLPVVQLYDLYSRLMPETLEKVDGAPSAPGGGMLASIRKRLNPITSRRFKPVALWSSTVLTESNGTATVEFDVPEFSGELRIMAVAVDRSRHGAAEKGVLVKRPLVVRYGLPRFVAPADVFSMPALVHNESDVDQTVSVEISFATNRYERNVFIPSGGSTNLVYQFVAPEMPGIATCRILSTMGEERFEEVIELAVRPAAPRVVHSGSGVVASGETTIFSVPFEWLTTTGQAAVHVSALPAVKLNGSFDYLVRYPYGCLEQTTSKSMPLLYLPELAEVGDVTDMVHAGIQRVLSMQRANGGFSLWPNGAEYAWGAIYATHFLAEATAANYDVPKERLSDALEHLEEMIEGRGGSMYDRAYACFVLAVAGRYQHGEVARLLGRKEELSRGGKINCAAALMAAGKRRQAVEFLDEIGAKPSANPLRERGGSLRSPTRDDALLLTVLLDVDAEHPWVPSLVKRLEATRENGRWYTTQENAIALMALGKYCRALTTGQTVMSGRINGAVVDGKEGLRVELNGSEVVIENDGDGPMFYHWKSEGVPACGEVVEIDCGIVARRELLSIDGEPVDSLPLRQGRVYIARITLEAHGDLDNLAVEDLLPAGLEIENARLKTAKTVSWIRGKQTLPIRHADARDDRMLLFTGAFAGRRTFHYAVRAVTEGEFVWPALAVECMYDSDIKSAHGKARVVIAK